MNISVYVASAFSKNNEGGNKAGVVLYNDLNETEKKSIAKKLGYAETAFISESNVTDFRIEYFTPTEEVPLCGHATIATFVVLMHLNKINKDNYKIETKSGILEITIKDDVIFMEQNKPQFYDEIEIDEIKNCFDVDCINPNASIEIVSTGLKDILVPIKNEEILNKLNPVFSNIIEISKKYNVVGTHLYTFCNERIICRNFAPLYGVDEEAATGTSNCALAGLLYEKKHLKKNLYVFEQGYSLNSISEIFVKIIDENNTDIKKIYVGGRGYFFEQIDISV